VTSSFAIRSALALSACVCLIPELAAAQDSSGVDMDAPGRSSVPAPAVAPLPRLQRRNDHSTQTMAFELRFGPYAPHIDNGVGDVTETTSPGSPCVGRKPGACLYGDKTRYQLGFEIDRQFWRAPHVGTLAVGFGWGFTSRSGPNKAAAVTADATPDDTAMDASDEPEVPIGQKGTLNIMPMYAVGVLRVDVLARELGVPLVGYGKLGLGYALWWVTNGRGTARVAAQRSNGEPVDFVGRDSTFGLQAALGAMFLLDALEPSAGAELDTSMGINNSYFFLEWSVSNFDDKHLDVGTNTWVAGLAVEL
jgi:hypothetical protein